jgi:serine/threonine protein kinase
MLVDSQITPPLPHVFIMAHLPQLDVVGRRNSTNPTEYPAHNPADLGETLSSHPTNPLTFDFGPDSFQVIRPLGTGAFSSVYEAVHVPSGQHVALKAVKLVSEELNSSMIRELGAFAQLVHNDAIVDYHGYYVQDGTIFLVLEHMDLGALSSALLGRPAPGMVIRALAYQMLVGLRGLHDAKIVHRDIKPSNILVNSRGQVKFADFNTSRVMRNSMDNAHTFTGTAVYMAPERLISRGHSFASDIWSVGVSLWEIAVGKNPFSNAGEGFWGLMAAINELPIPIVSDLNPAVDLDTARLVDACLQRSPEQRPSAEQLLSLPIMQEVGPVATEILSQYLTSLQ